MMRWASDNNCSHGSVEDRLEGGRKEKDQIFVKL